MSASINPGLDPAVLLASAGELHVRPTWNQDASFTVDVDLVLQGANHATSSLYGFDIDDSIGQSISDIVADAGHTEYLRHVLNGDDVGPYQFLRVGSDGTRRHISIVASPVVNGDEAIVGAVVFARSVNDLVLARDRYRAEREYFRRVFYGCVNPMAIVDKATRIIMANDAHCALLGYEQDEVVGLGLPDLTPDDDIADERYLSFLDGEVPTDVGFRRIKRKDGVVRWVESTISALRLPEGDDLGEYLLQWQDITEDREAQLQLQYLADHDPLTGLLNRRAFDNALLTHANRTQIGQRAPLGALLLIDLDHFKHHNDKYGHPSGDRMLIEVAKALRARVRETDVAARLGGDEFAVLLPDVSLEDAEKVAESLVLMVRSRGQQLAEDSDLPVTATIGIADFSERPDHELVYRNADQALYRAKSHGRGTWKSYRAGQLR